MERAEANVCFIYLYFFCGWKEEGTTTVLLGKVLIELIWVVVVVVVVGRRVC